MTIFSKEPNAQLEGTQSVGLNSSSFTSQIQILKNQHEPEGLVPLFELGLPIHWGCIKTKHQQTESPVYKTPKWGWGIAWTRSTRARCLHEELGRRKDVPELKEGEFRTRNVLPALTHSCPHEKPMVPSSQACHPSPQTPQASGANVFYLANTHILLCSNSCWKCVCAVNLLLTFFELHALNLPLPVPTAR